MKEAQKRSEDIRKSVAHEETKKFSPELLAFAKARGIDPSTIQIMNPPEPQKDYSTKILRERNLNSLDEKTSQELTRNLNYVRHKLGIDFTLSKEGKFRSLRSNTEVEQIEALKQFSENPEAKTLDIVIEAMPSPQEFHFGADLESLKFDLTHITIDTEADHHSEPLSIQCHNLEARRTVLAVIGEKFEWFEYKQSDGSTMIYMTTPNLNDAVLAVDIETVIAGIMISSMSQGHSNLTSLMRKLRKSKIPSFNHQILNEILFDTRRTVYILHNASYDVDSLKWSHQQAKRQLNLIPKVQPEVVKITAFKTKKQLTETHYNFYLGNIAVGFRYNLSTRKIGWKKTAKIEIKPTQADSYTLSYLVDTLGSAVALQISGRDKKGEKGFSLEALSNGLRYEKVELKSSKKIFDASDFPNPAEEYTESIKYGMYDLYATLSVYEMLTNIVHFDELSKVLKISKIEKTIYPFLSRITSTAKLAKHIIFAYYMDKLNMSQKEIEENVKTERQFMRNFEKTYLGGKVETFVHGLVKTTAKTKITYLDYASLYPHTAWLIEADLMYSLAIQGKLHKYIKSNIDEIKNEIKQSAKSFIKSIKDNTPLQKAEFRNLNGSVSISTSLKLQLPRRYKNGAIYKRYEEKINGSITCTIQDLTVAITRYHFETKTPLNKILRNINFRSAEYINLKEYKPSEYGKEFFTMLYIERKNVQAKIECVNDSHQKTILEGVQLLLKITMNSGYGISAEGVSIDNHTGVLYVPAIANAITATARSLTSLAEIASDYYGMQKLYTDTDSIQVRGNEEQTQKLTHLFEVIDKLKDESPKDPIQQLYVASKKSYGYLTKNGQLKINIHGRGQYDKEPFVESLKHVYNKIFTTKHSQKNISKFAEEAKHIHPLNQKIYLETTSSSIYKGLKKFWEDNSKHVHTLHYQNIPYYIYYNFQKDKYLITNLRSLRIGVFGDYLNVRAGKQTHNLTIYSTIPVEFNNLLNWILDTLYVEHSDCILNKSKQQTKWIQLYNIIRENNQNNVYTLPTTTHRSQISKLCKAYSLSFREIKTNPELLYNKIRQYGFLHFHRTISNISDTKSRNIFQTISAIATIPKKEFEKKFSKRSLIVYQIYASILDYLKSDINNPTKSFTGLEEILHSLLRLLKNRDRLKSKLEKYFTLNSRNMRRNVGDTKETFVIMNVLESGEKSKDPKLIPTTKNLNKTISTDGLSYHFKIPLANNQFSNELKANIDRYYTANILNTSISATKIYYKKKGLECLQKHENYVSHDPECNNTKCPIIKTIYTKQENLKIAPKKGNTIIIPLSIRIKPHIRHGKFTWYNLLDPKIRHKLEEKEICDTHGRIRNSKKAENWYLKYEKEEWQEIRLWNKWWKVNIVPYNSLQRNATLIINIRPEKNNFFTYRSIAGSLHINPLSFELLNLDLFDTTISECLDNTKWIKNLVKPLFLDPDMKYFTRNQSLTIEDIEAKGLKEIESTEENQKFYLKLFYQWVAKEIIREKINDISVKLTELSISQQTKIKGNRSLSISLLTDRILKQYSDNLPSNAKTYKQHTDKIQVYPHKASHGVSMTNTNLKYSLSIYAKDKRWLTSKVNRVGKQRDIPPKILERILNTEFDQHTIRYETALFGLESILKIDTEKILSTTKKAITKAFKISNQIETHFISEIKEIDQTLPQIYGVHYDDSGG